MAIPCLLCGGESKNLSPEKNIWRCSKCHFIFIDNEERLRQQAVFLEEKPASQSGVESLKKKYPKEGHGKKLLYTELANIVSGLLGDCNEGMSALDVGASGGFFLYEFEKKGVKKENLHCLEISNDYIKLTEEYFGYSNERVAIEKYTSSEKYNLISLLDVLEHVSDFKEALARIHDHLKPGGILLLKLPNADWVYFKYLLAKLCAPRFIKKLLYIEPGGHLNYWNLKNIVLLEQFGFEMIPVKKIFRPTKHQFGHKYIIKLIHYYLATFLGWPAYPEFITFFRVK